MNKNNIILIFIGCVFNIAILQGQVIHYGFSETSGSIFSTEVGVDDASTQGDTGAASTTTLNSAGLVGSGIKMDGNWGATLGNTSSPFKATGDFTVTMWVNLAVAQPNLTRLIDATNDNGAIGIARGWRILVNNGNQLALQLNDNGAGANINTTFTGLNELHIGDWSFVALRYNSSTGTAEMTSLHIGNDITEITVSENTLSASADVGSIVYGAGATPRLGMNQSGVGAYYNGSMDELRLFDSLLTDEGIAGVFNADIAAIPEPAVYSSLIGLLAFLLVASRRRLSRSK